jgi:hypothetical protein
MDRHLINFFPSPLAFQLKKKPKHVQTDWIKFSYNVLPPVYTGVIGCEKGKIFFTPISTKNSLL